MQKIEQAQTVFTLGRNMAKQVFDGVTITNVIGYLSGMFTLPSFITLFTFIWGFSRMVEALTGKALHEWIKQYCVFCKKYFK